MATTVPWPLVPDWDPAAQTLPSVYLFFTFLAPWKDPGVQESKFRFIAIPPSVGRPFYIGLETKGLRDKRFWTFNNRTARRSWGCLGNQRIGSHLYFLNLPTKFFVFF